MTEKISNAIKTKKGERILPKINYICIAMYKHLISEQRYAIYIMLQKNMCKKDIAKAIGVGPSTITRELQRNSGRQGRYNWSTAQANATYRKHRKPGNHAVKLNVKAEAVSLLVDNQWSPKQISGRLALAGKHISHETIYKMIRRDKANGGELYKSCRHHMKHRRRPVRDERIKIPDRISIHERPAEADGSRVGDLEMDTIAGKGNKGAIVTIIDKSTDWLIMRKLPHGKDAKETARTVVHLLEPYKKWIKTIATDNGPEFYCHEYIAKKLGVKVYFADPHAPWQKGGIENTNGLIRQYIPKGTDFKDVSQQRIKTIQIKINERPRQKLGFLTPNEAIYKKTS